MLKFKSNRIILTFATILLWQGGLAQGAVGKMIVARGLVFNDINKNGICDSGEAGIKDVGVSNGNEVVLTDSKGRYSLMIDRQEAIIFVIKPSGWMTRTDKMNIPRFYYLHNPKGSPKLRCKGVEPTGPLPKSVDFALYKKDEAKKFDVVLFGDPQLRNETELGYFYHDAIEEIAGINAAFGVMLGDIVFDNLALFENINKAVELIGINFYSLPGNHDMNYDAQDDKGSLETYKRIYGPPYYSFNYGDVHFIVLDNIIAKKNENKNWLRYDEGLTDEQLVFVKNDLAFVDKDKLVVVMGHSSFMHYGKNKKELLAVLGKYPHNFSIAGHDHRLENEFLDTEDGIHHVHVAGAVCGAWWFGVSGEDGIPHAMMSDGVPNGYSIVHFDGNKYSIRFKAFGKPADFQMRAFLPDKIDLAQTGKTAVLLNVFNGSKKSKVEMKLDKDGKWQTMKQTPSVPPYCKIALAEEKNCKTARAKWSEDKIAKTKHIWQAFLPADIARGTHILYFCVTDMYEAKYNSSRIFRVE